MTNIKETIQADWAKASQTKTLTGSHHVMYNLIRGHEATRGFSPITSKNKLLNGHGINYQFIAAYRHLQDICAATTAGTPTPSYQVRIDRFLAPFSHITIEMLRDLSSKLNSDAYPSLDSNFGIGKQLAEKIISVGGPLTYADLTKMLNEIKEAA